MELVATYAERSLAGGLLSRLGVTHCPKIRVHRGKVSFGGHA